MDDKLIYSSPVEGLEVLSCSSGREFKSHLHDGYVLWLNSESGEKYRLNGCSDILQPGSISIIEPETVHSNSPCCSERRHLRSFIFLKSLSVRSTINYWVKKMGNPHSVIFFWKTSSSGRIYPLYITNCSAL